MLDTENAITVKNLHKSFRLPHEQHSGVKQSILGLFKRNRQKGYETQHVLKGIDFEIKKGEFFGIIGRNGSGKSTLLKTLAGIYTPDKGEVKINGSLVPFIELGVGFNPELTGRENIFLNGALLGFSKSEMQEMYNDIVVFAELEKFMDQRLKNYSSGMQVRLAFSIAIRADADILLLDEVLAVGDEAFQRKCFQYFAQLKKNKKTVILVTHSMDNVTRFCDRALMLEDGKIIEQGSVKAVAERYIQLNADDIDQKVYQGSTKPGRTVNKFADVDVFLSDKNGKQKRVFRNKPEDEVINIKATFSIKQDIAEESFCSITIKNANGEGIARFGSESIDKSEIAYKLRKGDEISLNSEIQNIFGEGDYSVAISLKSIDRSESYIDLEDKASFSVAGLGRSTGGFMLRPHNKTTIERVP